MRKVSKKSGVGYYKRKVAYGSDVPDHIKLGAIAEVAESIKKDKRNYNWIVGLLLCVVLLLVMVLNLIMTRCI